MLYIVIANPNPEFCQVAEWRFRDHEMVETHCGKFEEIPCFDCVVTAGNSFGLMDAGIDLAVVKYFGESIQDSVQTAIKEMFLGEQPVGTSLIVPTGSTTHPWLAHTPTMRVPTNLNYTDNIYLATWGTLVAIHQHNKSEEKRKIESVVLPAFGVGTGGVDAMEATLQMLIAYEHFLQPPEFLNGAVAQSRHERIHYGSKWGFEHPRQGIDIE